MVIGPSLLQPVHDCTANYRSVLSSERAPYKKKRESNCQSKKLKLDHLSQRGPTWRRTGRLTVGCQLTSTSPRASYWTELQKSSRWDPDSKDLDKRRQFHKMESALWVTVAVVWGEFGNAGRGTCTVGSQCQRTGVGLETEKNKCMCSEL
jgi:hypothetical protein